MFKRSLLTKRFKHKIYYKDVKNTFLQIRLVMSIGRLNRLGPASADLGRLGKSIFFKYFFKSIFHVFLKEVLVTPFSRCWISAGSSIRFLIGICLIRLKYRFTGLFLSINSFFKAGFNNVVSIKIKSLVKGV